MMATNPAMLVDNTPRFIGWREAYLGYDLAGNGNELGLRQSVSTSESSSSRITYHSS
jgi:hypothetical protein